MKAPKITTALSFVLLNNIALSAQVNGRLAAFSSASNTLCKKQV